MTRLSQLNGTLYVIAFFFFAFLSKALTLTGYKVTGLDYLVWLSFASILFLINVVYGGQRLRLGKLYFVLLGSLLIFCLLNYAVSKASTISYIQGTFFSFLFALNFILLSNTKITTPVWFSIARGLIGIITITALVAYAERLLIPGDYNAWMLRGVLTIVKDPSFLSTLLNVNIVLCLGMFALTGRWRYVYIVVFSLLTISLLLFLKALLAALFTCFVFVTIFYHVSIKKFFMYTLTSGAVLIFVSLSAPIASEIEYKFQLYFGEHRERAPRNVLYVAAYQISQDYFPFGSGQGTFGSYPVGKVYSPIYYDYDLTTVHGLSPEDTFGNTGSHFIFDTHWSSIIGEMGFIAAFLYFCLWMLPAVKAARFIRSPNVETKIISFIIILTTISIFIEGIASPAPGQIAFIWLYTGLGGTGLRLLQNG